MADNATDQVVDIDMASLPVDDGQVSTSATDSSTDAAVDFAAFEAAKHQTSEPKKEDEVNKADEAQAKKVIEKAEKEEELTPAEKDVLSKAGKTLATAKKSSNFPPVRDLSDLPEEARPLFEKMSNDACAKLKPIYIEHNALKTKMSAAEAELAKRDAEIKQLRTGVASVPDSYYENEQAFVLTPEFNRAAESVNMAESVKSHWQSQLDEVAAGAKTYTPLVKDASGQIRFGVPVAVDPNTERVLQGNLAFAHEQVGQKKAALDSIAVQHKQKHTEASGWLGNWEKGTFPIFEKPEGKEVADMAADLITKFPAAYKSNPLMKVLAKSLVLNNKFVAMLQEKNKTGTATAATTTTKAKTTKAPSLEEVHGDGGDKHKSNGDEVTFDDFERLKRDV